MQIIIHKSARTLTLVKDGALLFNCRIALGSRPQGAKRMQGDGRTPEGSYFICLVKEAGKYGRSLGLSYPNPQDAQTAYAEGRIDERTLENVQAAHAERRRPPWGSPLGGEIYIHEGGAETDWTAGCIALETADMDVLFPYWPQVESVLILP
ncbi:MAG: L,D-transpeptidase family protein [Clostridia bacterium]|nr:L,D-transpeptidase family protein [Clostridia bacterium]